MSEKEEYSISSWCGVLSLKNLEAIRNMVSEFLTDKRYTFVISSEASDWQPRILRHVENIVIGPIFYDKNVSTLQYYGYFNIEDVYNVFWQFETGNEQEGPYIIFDHAQRLHVIGKDRYGKGLYWLVVIE